MSFGAGAFRLQDSLINFFSDYLPLHCHLVMKREPEMWYVLGQPQRRTQPLNFELAFGREAERRTYNLRCMAKAAKGSPCLGSHAGMHDLFVPVRSGGKTLAFVVFGSFFDKVPSRELLWAQWRQMRRDAGHADAEEFLFYVRAAVETPVLDQAMRRSLVAIMAAAGQSMLGLAPPGKAVELLAKVKLEVFSRRSPWRMWS